MVDGFVYFVCTHRREKADFGVEQEGLLVDVQPPDVGIVDVNILQIRGDNLGGFSDRESLPVDDGEGLFEKVDALLFLFWRHSGFFPAVEIKESRFSTSRKRAAIDHTRPSAASVKATRLNPGFLASSAMIVRD